MPVIEIKTSKKYEEAQKHRLLNEIDLALMEKLDLEVSRFLISWSTMDANSFLYKGINTTEANEEYPIVHIYTMEGKSQEMERDIMESISNVLIKRLNINSKNITLIFQRISSGNMYANGNYLE